MKKIFLLFCLLGLGVSLAAQEKKQTTIRPALLVIDVQKQFVVMVEQREKDIATLVINAIIKEFRDRGFPVIRIYHSSPESGPFPGDSLFEFMDEIAIDQGDPQVIKHYPNSFNKTDLDSILKEKNVNTLFLCGLSSVGCVLATYFGAQDHDYKAFMIKYGMMSHNSQYTREVEDIFEALGWDAIELMLNCAEK